MSYSLFSKSDLELLLQGQKDVLNDTTVSMDTAMLAFQNIGLIQAELDKR